MNAKSRGIALLATAICLISVALVLTTTEAKAAGRLQLLLQILRAFGLPCLLIALITTPLPMLGCTETEQQLRIQEVFLILGSGLTFLALTIDTASQPYHMQFWLYTGILFTVIAAVFPRFDFIAHEEAQPEVQGEVQQELLVC